MRLLEEPDVVAAVAQPRSGLAGAEPDFVGMALRVRIAATLRRDSFEGLRVLFRRRSSAKPSLEAFAA